MAKKITKTAKPVRVTTFADTAKIVVVKAYEAREGSKLARVWALVAKSKTIAAYKAARKAAKLGDGDNVGGMLMGFVNAGNVRITAK